ncbi:methyl-accepting chemotaxis protein [Neobacillus sp. D3-1R]|uniref:methyl-accepting chemotaxis protein n=1 Tax=Neobacillus sp. D3-1R TaxID=3445778 RepID=UPI003F9FF938
MKVLKSIKSKLIIFSLVLLLVPSSIIGVGSFYKSQNSLDEIAAERLKLQTKMVIQMIESMDKLVKEGSISLEEAQERVKVSVLGEKNAEGKRPINKEIAIGDYGYVVILNEKGDILAHPAAEGKNIWEAKTEDGTLWGQDMISKAMNGGGYSYFEFPLPDKPDVTKTKIAYTEKEPTWGWLVSSAQYMDEYRINSHQLLYFVSIIIFISLVIGIVLILLFSKRFTAPITLIGNHLNEISNGNLALEDLPIKSNDEIGQLCKDVNTLTNKFKIFIEDVTKTIEHVASSSAQLNAITDETSKVTEDVANSIQEVAAGNEKQMERMDILSGLFRTFYNQLEQINHTIHWVSESTNIANKKSNEGNTAIEAVIGQMDIIGDHSKQMDDVITLLANKSNEISEIISMITSISNQTNLLALNAAIEAARAGEHGKGFAVVADEVRKLAEQSGESATKISQLINEIQNSSKNAKDVMQRENEVVSNGILLAHEAGEKFKEIITTIDQVSSKTFTVSQSIEETKLKASTMVQQVEELENYIKQSANYATEVAAATEETTASVEEISAATDTLASMADELQGKVTQFKVR